MGPAWAALHFAGWASREGWKRDAGRFLDRVWNWGSYMPRSAHSIRGAPRCPPLGDVHRHGLHGFASSEKSLAFLIEMKPSRVALPQ